MSVNEETGRIDKGRSGPLGKWPLLERKPRLPGAAKPPAWRARLARQEAQAKALSGQVYKLVTETGEKWLPAWARRRQHEIDIRNTGAVTIASAVASDEAEAPAAANVLAVDAVPLEQLETTDAVHAVRQMGPEEVDAKIDQMRTGPEPNYSLLGVLHERQAELQTKSEK